MKVYVCYRDYDYEGASQPLAAFINEQKAKDWVKANDTPRKSASAEYVTLEE